MKTLIFLSCLLLILVSQVSAVTLSENVRFNQSVPAGQTVFFDMRLTPDSTEKEVSFKSIEVTGDCSPWVTVNRTDMRFTDSQTVRAAIGVPAISTNGMHRCDITFIAGGGGMIGYALGVPISVNVTGGSEPTIEPTETYLPISTTDLPTYQPTETITAPAPAEQPTEPMIPLNVVLAVLVVMAVIFLIVVIYEEKVRK